MSPAFIPCPHCHRSIWVRNDGLLAKHVGPDCPKHINRNSNAAWAWTCPGSETKPKDPS